ncbi:MAG: MBL fold metallo-hydrolase [Candidatus Saccharibacteria bacterium]|nr:MBL fold metallo-hydrolase [Candidatus Saccharibacteria bacterium]
MQISFFGANCLKIKVGSTNLIFDDNLKQLGAKPVTTSDDVLCLTANHLFEFPDKYKLLLDSPGSYEVGEVFINGIEAQSYMDETGILRNTIYRIEAENLSVAVVGHIQANLRDNQLERLGIIDILLIPVGNNGYTLDATGALQLTKNINPKIVIPTHYHNSKLQYEVSQQDYKEFVKQLAIDSDSISGTFKINRNELSETLSLKIFA